MGWLRGVHSARVILGPIIQGAALLMILADVPSPVPLSPLPGPVDLGLSSKTFSEVEQSLNDLLDNPPSTKDRKRYDRWLNVKLTRAVRELMVKYIGKLLHSLCERIVAHSNHLERTIGRKLVPTSKIKSSVGSICPQFNDPHLPNCFEWHFTAEYPIFPSKRIGEWTFVEVIGCKKALENYDLYPYDLEEEPELPREKRRLLDLARTSFKQHICNIIEPIAINKKLIGLQTTLQETMLKTFRLPLLAMGL